MRTARVEDLELICHEVRRRMFSTILNAGSGHLGGSSSSVELMVSLYFGGVLRYDPADPRHLNRDRVLVRGHLGPLRYSIFSLLGWVKEEELLTYRRLGSRLQGHEAMESVPGVDITPSGSLGMLLSYGVGAAVALRDSGSDARVYVFLGDGEEQEGNVSEAARHVAHLKLNNLTCILDRNTRQLSRPTSTADGATDLKRVWEGYGWQMKEIADGHSITQILDTFHSVENCGKPLLIVANTVKGYGVAGAETHFSGYHTIGVCTPELVKQAIQEQESLLRTTLGREGNFAEILEKAVRQIPRPSCFDRPVVAKVDNPSFAFKPTGDEQSVVDAFVTYLQQLTVQTENIKPLRLYVMTADLIQLDQVTLSGLDRPDVHYFDVGIREQHLLAMAHGISVTESSSRILINYGDAFLYRGSDQLHAAAQAGSRMVIVGDDGGLSGAGNGSTHQSSGQPGILLTMPGVTFLEPADVEDFYNCLNWVLSKYPRGPVYIRLHNAPVQSITLPPGGQRNVHFFTVYEPTVKLQAVVVSAGLVTHGAIEAARRLESRDIGVRVVNVINPKSLDKEFVGLLGDGLPVLTVYNGSAAVLQFAVAKAAMECETPRPSRIVGHGFDIGTSGKINDLIKHFKIDGAGIEEVMRQKFPEIF
ncbi:MAG: Transketolase [candidate division WS2 bacterium]|nr:Transketolase [Candidatus Lithacetigena glycinireducens]